MARGLRLRRVADDLEENDGPLTADEILLFGPCVEAQVWTPTFIAEKRAPIAVAAGRPKLGPIFNSEGVGKAVLIRPCVSRGKRIRGLPPIYTPRMLEANAKVFAGWPMYLDHMPAALAEAVAKRGRSVKEMGGQVLAPYFDREFAQEYDAEFGYQAGGVLAEIWATPYLRGLVGENPNLLHTSIAAWPTSGKPGPVPWNPKVKGMAIEGIRRQPQGSVDFVPRGGAGGRLLLAEGEDVDRDLSPWPEPVWEEKDVRLVVSLAERLYAAPQMSTPTTEIPNFGEMNATQLREWALTHQPRLAAALVESAAPVAAPTAAPPAPSGLTADDVERMIREAHKEAPTREEFDERLQEALDEREGQRHLAGVATEMIRVAEGIPATWKADLSARYAMLPSGPSAGLLVESETDDKGAVLSEEQVLRRNVERDLSHVRDLIAEATGKPRVTGEGGATAKSTGVEGGVLREGAKPVTPYWRESFAEMGIVESADDALSIHGVSIPKTKTEG